MDRNHDGSLSFEEFAAGMARIHQHAAAARGRMGGPAGHHRMAGPMGRPMGNPMGHSMGRSMGHPAFGGPYVGRLGAGPSMGERGAEMFEKMDANHDHQLSRDEAPPRLKAHFADIDRNKDGQLSPQELKQAFEAKFSHPEHGHRDAKPDAGPRHDKKLAPPDRKPVQQP